MLNNSLIRKESITQIFSTISKKDSLRSILELIAYFDLEMQQMDVKTTFLNGDLEVREIT
jgi:hypothetical protein